MQRARYVGPRDADGLPRQFLPGVPARSLSDEEYRALEAEERAAVRDSGLYEVRTDAEMAGPKAPTAKGGLDGR